MNYHVTHSSAAKEIKKIKRLHAFAHIRAKTVEE
jgi:hypothetical protein